MMKKNFLVGLLGVFIGLVLLPGSSWGQQTVLRYAGQLPTTHHLTKADYRFAKMVEEKTNGKVKIEIYPAGQLYRMDGIRKAVMSGTVDMGVTYEGTWTGPIPSVDFFIIPFVLNNYREVQKAWGGKIGNKLRDEMEKNGVKALGFGAYGESFSITNIKKPLKRPEDFKGLKIRTHEPIAAESVKALGASPVFMSSAEVYTALQKGTVDGATSGPTSFVQRKWYEITKYSTITFSVYSVWPVMINLKVWNGLPKEIQKILEEAGKDYENHTIQISDKEDEEAIKFLSKTQEVYILTDEDKKVWARTLEPVKKEFLSRTGKDGEAFFKWIAER
ncbi:MAG: DctP family TRAP transporter solute-binding subunit [Thermodesulfobacteriota bacterium]|nr:DctP family TRAP transporter solute-binding subunit [Thermodesulfobacteriota bacterium]